MITVVLIAATIQGRQASDCSVGRGGSGTTRPAGAGLGLLGERDWFGYWCHRRTPLHIVLLVISLQYYVASLNINIITFTKSHLRNHNTRKPHQIKSLCVIASTCSSPLNHSTPRAPVEAPLPLLLPPAFPFPSLSSSFLLHVHSTF